MSSLDQIRDPEYLLDEVTEDRRVPQSATLPGFWPRITGVDGRFNGSVKPFPGWKFVHQLGNYAGTGSDITITDVHDLWPVSVNVGSDDIYHGFVARVLANSNITVIFDYYDGSAWQTVEIESQTDSDLVGSLAATVRMDVVVIGRLIYIFRDGREPTLVYFDDDSATTAVVLKDTGPGSRPVKPSIFLQASQPNQSTAPAVPLQAGKYAFCYQFVDSVTGRVSGLSQVTAATDDPLDSGVEASAQVVDLSIDSYVRFDINLVEAGVWNAGTFTGKWDQVRVYRSIRTEEAGGTIQGSIYFLEGQFSIDSTSDPYVDEDNYTFNYWFSLPDLALTNQEIYANSANFLANMPSGFAAIEQEGTLFVSTTSQQGDDPSAVSEIRWSSPIETSPELFPPSPVNRRRLGSPGAAPLLYRRAGPVIVGASANEVYLILKLGANVEILRAHRGQGAVSNKAGTSFENSVYLVSHHGMLRVSSRGEIEPLHALDRLIMQDWRADYSDLVTVHDPVFGVVFVLNPTQNEMACLWSNTQKLTSFEGVGFVTAGVGVDPNDSANSQDRAIFATVNGCLYRPDENPPRTSGGWFTSEPFNDLNDLGGLGLMADGRFAATATSGYGTITATASVVPGSVWSITITAQLTADQAAKVVGTNIAILTGSTDDFTGRYARILGVTSAGGASTTFTVGLNDEDSAPFAVPVSSSLRVLFNPTILRLRGYPAGTPVPDTNQRDYTRLRTIDNINLVFTGFTSDATGGDERVATYWASVYEGNTQTPTVTAKPVDHAGADVVALENNASRYGAKMRISGNIVLPEALFYVNGYTFEALSMLVTYNMQKVDARRG